MTTNAPITDVQSIHITKPAEQVFEFMADPSKLDLWSFGTWQITLHADSIVEGRSIFDGTKVSVRIDPCAERLLIDYLVGSEPNNLQRRIFARITPGTVAGLDTDSSLLILAAIRSVSMTDARWQRLQASHAFELQLIKSLLETGYDHRH